MRIQILILGFKGLRKDIAPQSCKNSQTFVWCPPHHILVTIRKSTKHGHSTRAESWQKNAVSWQTRNNRKLPKHKLSQNAKNLQFLLKFGLIEDNVTVFQWLWNSESAYFVNQLWLWKNLKEKKHELLRKCFFREKDS